MSDKNEEKMNENSPIPVDIEGKKGILQKMKNSICKIFKDKEETGVGFFCYIPYNDKKLPVLVTNNHLINEKYINNYKKVKISINENRNNYEIIIDGSRKIYSNQDYDITIIEIKEEDGINNHFLVIDEKLFKNNVKDFYEGKAIYIIQYTFNDKVCISSGIIKEIKDYELRYSCSTDIGSSGSAIIILEDYTIIGIHHQSPKKLNLNKGIFLKNPFNDFIKTKLNNNVEEKYNNKNKDILNNIKKSNKIIDKKENISETKKTKENKIIIKVKVEEEKVGKEVFFLNGRNYYYGYNPKYRPLDQIEDYDIFEGINKNDVELYIDNNKQNFRKYFTPENKGIYQITLKFNINMTDCRDMFSRCTNIINIDLSSFNTKNVTDMSRMFSQCEELESINLTNFDTKNVLYMDEMFFFCKKLEELDLFSFNTEKVKSIKSIFNRCENLEFISNLYFNLQNISSLEKMFFQCYKLCNIDLSFLNTKNIIKMCKMFADCYSLFSIDLSYFDTTNLSCFCYLFGNCKNLEIIVIRKETYEKIKSVIKSDIEIIFDSKKNIIYN